MGWDQVTLKHAALFMGSTLPLRMRLGLCWIFVGRWLTQMSAWIFGAFGVFFAVIGKLQPGGFICTPERLKSLQNESFDVFIYLVILAIAQVFFHDGTLRTCGSVILYFALLFVYGLCNIALLVVSLVRNGSGNLGKWVCTPRQVTVITGSSKDETKDGTDSSSFHSADSSGFATPLLPESQPEHIPQNRCLRAALWLLAFLSMICGAILGSFAGAIAGRHEVEVPLWGWVPFGIGARTITVYDGTVIAKYTLVGAALGTACGPLWCLLSPTSWRKNRR